VRAARSLFAILALAWIVLLLAAPVTALGAPIAAAVYAFGSVMCHQRPERSFHLAQAQLPVCARCLGLYAGAAAGAIGILAALRSAGPKSSATPSRLRTILLVAAIPTATTWGGELLGAWFPENLTRFVAALPLGAAVAVTVNYVECARPPRTELRPPRILI